VRKDLFLSTFILIDKFCLTRDQRVFYAITLIKYARDDGSETRKLTFSN